MPGPSSFRPIPQPREGRSSPGSDARSGGAPVLSHSTRSRGFRTQTFLVLLLVALVPTVLLLGAGAFGLREVVRSTGSAGAWEQVGRTGQALLDGLSALEDVPSDLVAVAERHRDELAQSVQFSRLYGFLGGRLLSLVPVLSAGLLLLVAALALVTATWFSKRLSRPVEEIVGWTRALGAGEPLPLPDEAAERREIREFGVLKSALRTTAERLAEARLREADRIRTRSWAEMARGVAHELKNPLTPMRLAAERVARSSEPPIAEAGDVLREEIVRLETLARAFAHFGRPVEGPPARVDLTELVTSLARKLSTPEVPIDLDAPQGPVEVLGYLDSLERVVRNLLANAQEATTESGAGRSVRLTLRSLEAGAEIRVLDRGPGMQPPVLDRMWEPEFTSKRRGTGLGLPLVRKAVQAHGGVVWAFNRDGGGSGFVVRLPFDAPGAGDNAPPESGRWKDGSPSGRSPS